MKNKLFFIFVFLCFSFGCKNNNGLSDIDISTFVVKTEKPQSRDINEEILLSGSIKAKEEAILYPRISGKLLKNVLKEGDYVAKNQTVALIERDEVGVVYEPAPVPSTINGIVGLTYLDVGATVDIQTPIALVVNIDEVRVQVDVPERYVSKIFIGQTASVGVEAFDAYFQGRVYKISPVVDTQSRSIPVEILVDNTNHKLKSGMFAQANIVAARKNNVMSISKEAVLSADDGSKFVFTVENSKALKKPVVTGISDDKFIEITKGLARDSQVINFGLYGLKDQSSVKVE